MKFAWKIFTATFLIIVLSFGIGGFILINSLFNTSLKSVINTALSENKLICVSLNSLLSNTEMPLFDYTISSFSKQINGKNRIIIDEISSVTYYSESHFSNLLQEDEQGYQIISQNDVKYIQIVSLLNLNDSNVYIESIIDISETYNLRTNQCNTYMILLACVALFGSAALMIFSYAITKPLGSLSIAAQEIAQGNYDKRAPIQRYNTSKEITALTKNFNIMADNMESYIEKLRDEAKRQEDFVGNFTHELKTPLTSIIGYADMLRSFDLDQDTRRTSAEYIYREGKRLEALSLHLLNLIVVRNSSITLQNINTTDLFSDIKNSLHFTIKKYDMSVDYEIEDAAVRAEPVLMKTVLANLVENACKASKNGDAITVTGKVCKNKYRISVIDHGCGIPENELLRITEAFYMVDKSRAREKGSAGLGLALCSEILRLHNTELNFQSEVGVGTTVSLELEAAKDDE